MATARREGLTTFYNLSGPGPRHDGYGWGKAKELVRKRVLGGGRRVLHGAGHHFIV